MNTGLAVLENTDISRFTNQDTLQALSQSTKYLVPNMQRIDSDALDKVAANCPLDNALQYFHPDFNSTIGENQWRDYATSLLEQHFSQLLVFEGNNIDFSKYDSPNLFDDISAYADELETSGFTKQTEVIRDLVDSCQKVCSILTKMPQHNLGVLHILPIKYLMDITVAFPVWYHGESGNAWGREEPLNRLLTALGSKDFAWFQQLYSKWTPCLDEFDSLSDPMPRNVLKVMNDMNSHCDFSAIATPYHELASEAWNNIEMQRMLADPLLFGYVKNFPFVFLFARWSGNGVLPGFPDMIHATVEHLRQHKDELVNVRRNTPWAFGETSWQLQKQGKGKGAITKNTLLPDFADKILKAYDEHRLFQLFHNS